MSDAVDQGDVTPEELQQIQSADQIGERYYQYFIPNLDAVADDDSWADSGDLGD